MPREPLYSGDLEDPVDRALRAKLRGKLDEIHQGADPLSPPEAEYDPDDLELRSAAGLLPVGYRPPAPQVVPTAAPVAGGAPPPPPIDAGGDELAAAQGRDALRQGGGRVSDALYAAFTRSPVQFRSRPGSEAGELVARRGEQDREVARSRTAALKDPASEESKRLRDLFRSVAPEVAAKLGDRYEGLPGSFFGDGEGLLDMAVKGEGSRRARADAEAAEAKRFERAKELALIRSGRKGKAGTGAGKGRDLPAGEAAEIGDMDAIEKQIAELDAAWTAKANDFYSGVAQYIPGTDAAQYTDAQLLAAQSIGTALEGGKLTDSDLKDKYLPLMPTAGDSKQRKDAKLSQLRKMAEAKRAARVGGLKQGGFDVSKFEAGHLDLDRGPTSVSEEDRAAIEWAKANPKHPAAAEILRLNGVK